MNGHKTVGAAFTQNAYTLTVTVSGGGSVTRAPNQAHYHYGDVVTLTATPNLGWMFAGWSGAASGSANPITLTMNGHKTVGAAFTPIEYTLTVNAGSGGSVTQTPNRATYHYGDGVTLTASALPGWTFAGWSGAASGSANPITLTMNGHKTVGAAFTLAPRPVTGVSFSFVPPSPLVNDPVWFTTALTPANATQPVTYTWTFGDGTAPMRVTTTTLAHTLSHTFAHSGTFTVWLTATNAAGTADYHRSVPVTGPTPEPDEYYIFLPVVLRQN